AVGDPGREFDDNKLFMLPCSDDRPEFGIEVEYEGGGCKSGVTSERHEAKRASND
ncbi:hypothetical protein BGZ58_000252, partial [Dissophora ornata]